MEQHPLTDFFDQKVQKTTGKNNRTIYKMNNETGEGIITQYIILPGIQFFYNDFHMSNGQNQNKLPHADVLELNHCREGRFECRFANGTYQYIGSGDLAINLLSNQTVSTSFPLSHYHGISITIDLQKADSVIRNFVVKTCSCNKAVLKSKCQHCLNAALIYCDNLFRCFFIDGFDLVSIVIIGSDG